MRPEAAVIGGVTSREGCYVGAGAVIRGATLGRHIMARMHAVIQDGVSIGEQALVRARCVVLGDADLPAGNLVVGLPGRIVGEVTDGQKHAWDLGLKPCPELPSRCEESLRQQERTR